MRNAGRDRGDPLDTAWQRLRLAEPPESLYESVHYRVLETPQRHTQPRIAGSLAGLAAALTIAVVLVGGAVWGGRPAVPGTGPTASSTEPSASPSPSGPDPTASPPGPDPSNSGLPPPVPGQVWSRDGQKVPRNVLSLRRGPEHCGWEKVLFLGMSSRLGQPNMSSDDLMEYVRDPLNVLVPAADHPDVPRTLGYFEPSVSRPADAVFTGYVYPDGMELWRSEAATSDTVFLRRGDIWERWPRSASPIACA
jgi:hypothetical protein